MTFTDQRVKRSPPGPNPTDVRIVQSMQIKPTEVVKYKLVKRSYIVI